MEINDGPKGMDEPSLGSNDTMVDNTSPDRIPPDRVPNMTTDCPTPTARNVIDSTGMCLSCSDVQALEKSIPCFMCNKKFHAICREDGASLVNVNCNKTFLDQFSKRNEKNDSYEGHFLFICDPCKTNHEIKNAGSMQSHVHCLERKVDNMESSLAEIKSLLSSQGKKTSSTDLETVPNPQTSKNPWNNPSRTNKMRENLEIAVTHTSTNEAAPFKEIGKLVVENGICVQRKYVSKTSGETVFVLPSENDAATLQSKITESFPNTTVRKKQQLLPTISIANIEEELSSDELKKRVINCHPEIKQCINNGETFNVLSVRKQKNSTLYYALVRVSCNIRKFINSIDNRVYIGQFSSCKTFDHFHVKRCDRCQKFGHFKASCSATHACLFCAGPHPSDQCTHRNSENFVPSCSNCKSSSDVTLNGNHNHQANDSNCASYRNAQNRLRLNISYYSSEQSKN